MSPKDLLDHLAYDRLKQSIARQLILHARKEKVSNLAYLPFIRIKHISGHDDDALILDTILFMINNDCIYEKRWEFIDQDDNAHDIDYFSVVQARKDKVFRHPETNQIVENFSQRMSMYFTINRCFKNERLESNRNNVKS